MYRGIFPLMALALIAATSVASVPPVKNNRALFTLWGKISAPLPGDPRPIGSYSAGCIAGARRLELDGPGYSVMRPSRNRFFGHPDLLSYIQGLGKKLQAQKLPRLLVGDMGRPRGGPMPTGHMSHQIGLDVDLWYRMSRKRPSLKDRESWSAPSFLKGENKLSPAWNDSYRKLLVSAADSPFVNRIFVNAVIKRDLCQHFPDAPWLYKFRAWWAHHDHLHVRLNCPEGNRSGSAATTNINSCQAQAALDPKDNQCGKELDWWFSAEAKEEGSKKEAAFSERAFPELPGDCSQMVEDMTTGNLRAENK